MRIEMIVLAVAMAGLSVAAPVTLTVREHGGVARTAAPVRGGVPFALGALPECSSASLVDAAGTALPCRVRPISHWHDGSVKFLLVDTQVSLPANGSLALRLTAAEGVPGQDTLESVSLLRSLSVGEDADEIVVLRRGRIVERGDHASLLAADGWYASQWRYQQLQASLDDEPGAGRHPAAPDQPASTRGRPS